MGGQCVLDSVVQFFGGFGNWVFLGNVGSYGDIDGCIGGFDVFVELVCFDDDFGYGVVDIVDQGVQGIFCDGEDYMGVGVVQWY